MSTKLKMATFGRFQIAGEDQALKGVANKRSKMWSALKCLIAYRGRPVPAEKLAEFLWPDDDADDPVKLLKDIIYRLRKALAGYGGDQNYILFSEGNYIWNPEVDCWIDVMEFDDLLAKARDEETPPEERMGLYSAAIDLYQGPFLSDTTIDIWTMSFTNFYRRLFLQAVTELADIYESESMLDEIVMLHDKAISNEPYEESLYVRQIQTLINSGEYVQAKRQYRHIEQVLMREFSVAPSPELQRLSYEVEKAAINHRDSIEEITQRLEQEGERQGVLFCGPETFQKIYTLDKRSGVRVQFPVYLAVVTIVLHRKDAPEKEMDYAMKSAAKAVRQILLTTLRDSDIMAQYSKSQFLLMLTVMNTNGGSSALQRVKSMFENRFGRENGTIEFNMTRIGRETGDFEEYIFKPPEE